MISGMSIDIPTIETERLRLVPPEPRHFDAFAALLADPEFVRHLEIAPCSRLEAHRSFCAMIGHWQLRGWGGFLLEERTTANFVGRVGISDWEGWPEPELGWSVIPAAWGRGYAVESARAVLDFVRGLGRTTQLASFVRASNAQSIRVAEKLGATYARDIELFGKSARVYVHTL